MDHRRELNDNADAMCREIGEALRAERERQGITQSDVAQKVGVSRATVIAAESGQSVSTLNMLRMAAAIGLSFKPQPDPNFKAQPEPAIVTPRHPTLKELMRMERERQAMLQAKAKSLGYDITRRPTLKEQILGGVELQEEGLHKDSN